MKKLFICIFILTLFDAAATVTGVKLGYLEELNPLFRRLFDTQPLMAGFAVCFATVVLLLVLYALRRHVRWLRYAMSAVLIVKSVIVCMHIVFVFSAI